MSEIISNRSELLFLYDIENANPNGDPLNENRPRFDTESSTILVSDVRLKRTIRDYWFEYKGYNGQGDNQDVFVRETTYDEGDKTYIKDGQCNPFQMY
jgi:CRISPR-associated protein Csh2